MKRINSLFLVVIFVAVLLFAACSPVAQLSENGIKEDSTVSNYPDSVSEISEDDEKENGGAVGGENADTAPTSSPLVADGAETGDDTKEDEPTVSETEVKTVPPVTENTATQTQQYVCVLCEGLNIRAEASTAATVYGQAQKNTLYPCCGKENKFYKTFYRGKTAYLSSSSAYTKLVEIEQKEERVESVIDCGQKLLGTPYVYGAVRYHDGQGNLLSGFTSQKFDCSSLMQYIFYKGANILLQVNTRTQVLQGSKIARSEVRRGDLLFFTNAARCNNVGIERVGHVALYLGENYILHTSSDYAKIERLTAEREGYFLQARRMF